MFETETELRAKMAELYIVDLFDTLRPAHHDYGAGQRASELIRRRREVEALGGSTYPDPSAFELDELVGAFDRVARPRIARLDRENYRAATAATRATRDGWLRVERSLARAARRELNVGDSRYVDAIHSAAPLAETLALAAEGTGA